MKYSELISFNPIEDVIQLTTADNADKAREYVKTYVMSDTIAESLQAPVIDQLQMDEVIDNKGVLVVGNYGTGKSHLMSVISSIAHDADNLQYLQNKKFAKSMKQIAGKFEVLRIEIGGVTMSLREILFDFIKDDFDERGISFDVPNFNTVKDNKKLIKDMMMAFSEKYPDKGYLIVVDEFLSYLASRNQHEIVLDLEFFRALGELCSKSKLRVIFGVQEKIFDNPRFSFISDTLKRVSDRFTQIIITKEATSYVVSERILKKTPEQKALIRAHLEKFCNLYTGMLPKLDDFVDLFPIHPAYIDVFNKISLIENRHILKNISLAIKNIFDANVPEDAPGVISFDDYWPAIKSNGLLKSDVTINRVVNVSSQLEEIINRAFPKEPYKPLAIKIIYALSVHRLTTNGLDVQFGLTAENLKDDLCLHLPIPEQDADFLLGVVNTTLRDIMTTVSGQFIICNDANNQYYIDVNKVVDYDEKIRQKASLMADTDLDRYFYQVVYSCLEWDKKQYVTGFNIYEHDINWESHNIFREGYLFMGLPGERSTAEPERDYYIHIMPPYAGAGLTTGDLDDEVYFYFKSNDEFKNNISMYSAASSLADISEGKDKEVYLSKATILRKKLVKYLSENKSSCFDLVYKREHHQLVEVLKGYNNRDNTFGDTIDLAASICLDGYFNRIYPDFPVMKTKITRKNMYNNARAAFDHFADRKSQLSTMMLQSFGILDGDNIHPEGSKYASYYIDLVKALPPHGVLNYSDLFEQQGSYWQIDKKFRIWHVFTPIIFLSMVYSGYGVITLKNGDTITTSTLERVPKIDPLDLYEFKYLSKPAQIQIVELKKLFTVLGLNPALLDNPNDREKGVEDLLKKAQELCNSAVMSERKLTDSFELWGEPLVNDHVLQKMRNACTVVNNEFSNYTSRFNKPAKLNNFSLSREQIDELGKSIAILKLIPEYLTFKTDCSPDVNYVSSIEYIDIGTSMKSDIENAKANFREIRDSIFNGTAGDVAAQKVCDELRKIKGKYIDIYFETHKKKRLGIEDAKRMGTILECLALSNLRKLRGIDILSGAKLTEIEQDLESLKVCCDLTSTAELKQNPTCPHCHFSLEDKIKNVYGQLDNIEGRIDSLVTEWTNTLINTISDPLLLSQKKYLNAMQANAIDSFVTSGQLPKRVDDFFVSSIQALLKNYDPVIIEVEELIQKLEQLPPMDESAFKAKLNEVISAYTKGKDASTLRIVVKRRESEK
jgi:hypothetical protein